MFGFGFDFFIEERAGKSGEERVERESFGSGVSYSVLFSEYEVLVVWEFWQNEWLERGRGVFRIWDSFSSADSISILLDFAELDL